MFCGISQCPQTFLHLHFTRLSPFVGWDVLFYQFSDSLSLSLFTNTKKKKLLNKKEKLKENNFVLNGWHDLLWLVWPIMISEKKNVHLPLVLLNHQWLKRWIISDLDRKFTIWPKHTFELMGEFDYNHGQAIGRLANRNLM